MGNKTVIFRDGVGESCRVCATSLQVDIECWDKDRHKQKLAQVCARARGRWMVRDIGRDDHKPAVRGSSSLPHKFNSRSGQVTA